jgi:hypothetical protein
MNPQAVTVGARFGRRLTPVLSAAADKSGDRLSFCGGLIATVAGTVAGICGRTAAAELLRISLARLEGGPVLELPPGVRLAIAAAEAGAPAAANEERRAFGMTKARLLALVGNLPDDALVRVADGGEAELEILSIYSGEPGEAWIDVGRAQ